MKKKLLFLTVATLLTCVACNKEKSCRCSVKNSQTVRIININKGDCANITQAEYYDELDTLHIDTVYCTDYHFAADSTIIYDTTKTK